MNSQKITLAIIATLSASLALADDLTTINGKVYKNATVTRVEADGITVKFSGGLVKIPFPELSKELQEKYNYDPQKAAAAYAAEAAAVQQANQQTEETNKQREKEKQVALESSRRAREEAAKAQNTTIEPGNNTVTEPRITGVGGINGLEVEVDDKRLQLAAEAREEAMTPQDKANQLTQDLKTYEGAKQVAARRGLDSNLIVPPRYGQVHYDPFANFVR
jgi:hypothetical protein